MSFKYENSILYEKDDIIITEYHYPEIPFLDNLEYEDNTICFTADKMMLVMASKIDYVNDDGSINVNNIKSENLIDTLLMIAKTNKKTYLEGVENEDIIKATIFCDKRDLTKMYYKLLINEDFTYKQLYEYIITAYSRIEDDYGYDILSNGMEYCINKDKSVKEDIISSISNYANDNKIIAYRGVNKFGRNEDGLSYTLDKKVAEFFAKRWNSDGIVNTYEIGINDILAFIDEGEKEIISKKAKLLKV